MQVKSKIILVDDSDQKRATYSDKFKSEGFDMPEMDGFTMIRELKKDPELAKIPIMISSHLNREKDQLTAKGLGVQEFIYYGFVTVNEVVKKARNLLGEKK